MRYLRIALLLGVSSGLIGNVNATMLDGTLTVDNIMTAYISTDDSVAGTQLVTNSNWPTISTFSSALTPAVTNYLHILAVDVGVIAMFIGEFSLSDADFEFSNGTQQLLSNTADWQVSLTGFGSNYQAPISQGLNGVSPWGTFGAIDSSASFIWETNDCVFCTLYFSTPIVAVQSSNVPEPATLALMALGLIGIGYSRRKTLH